MAAMFAARCAVPSNVSSESPPGFCASSWQPTQYCCTRLVCADAGMAAGAGDTVAACAAARDVMLDTRISASAAPVTHLQCVMPFAPT